MFREFKIKTNHRAFTLVELVISAAIFALIIGAAFTVFISISRLQRKTIVAQRLAGEGRYLIEAMARTIREGRIVYLIAEPYGASSNFININDLQGSQIKFSRNAAYQLRKETSGILTADDILSSTNIKINNLKFYIQPNTQSSAQKPIVLITLSAENAEVDASIKDTIYLQTAVESRYY